MSELLFLVHRVPNPPNRGDKIRSHHLLRKLRQLRPVHLVCFADDEADLEAAEALRPGLASLHVERRTRSKPAAALRAFARREPILLPLFGSETMRAHVARLLAERPIDALLAFSIQMAHFVPENLGKTRFVMDFVDMDSAKFAAYAEAAAWPMRSIWSREASLLLDFEHKTAAHADASLFVSDAEAALFRAALDDGAEKVSTLENGVDLTFFNPAAHFDRVEGKGGLIAFTGQMDYRPNIEAVAAFARETMPLIRAARPDARFAIVGRNPAPEVARLAALPGVEVIGAVPDIRAWLAAADVVVAPLRTARGVQNKVLEAMAMARPVVASPAAFEGIDAEAGRDLMVADGAQAESKAIISLLADNARARAFGVAARARVAARYGWDAALERLPALLGLEEPVPIEAAA
ncbi:MAG: TIGR03087 family PEP-CTERM/XrtA system glycosyltransferase [Sphingomonadaceae bacterium]|nr:TIGR03087 family PEP-CTERM/XrtA system glycosyltransferase [Sphingomonadaceae bacterium]